MKSFKTLLKTAFVASCTSLIMTSLPVMAFNGAILSGIKVKLLDNQNYQIILKADKDIQIKKFVTAANKVVLDLKNVKPAEFINTIYNNAPEVDHVIVQPMSGDKLRIFLQGSNMSSSKIILDTRDETLSFLGGDIPAGVKSEPVETIKPKRQNEPVFIDLSEDITTTNAVPTIKLKDQTITPIVSYKNESRNNFNSVKSAMGLGSSTNSFFDASMFDWVLRFLMIGAIAVGGIKVLTRPKNIKIDLASGSIKEQEIDLYRSVNNKKELLNKSIGSISAREKALKRKNIGGISQYGIKEYQNSQKPPVAKKPIPVDNKALKSQQSAKLNSALKSYGNQQQQVVSAKPAKKIAKKEVENAQGNFDGVKFLETMAQIYEKNGQADLARGIKKNITRERRAG